MIFFSSHFSSLPALLPTLVVCTISIFPPNNAAASASSHLQTYLDGLRSDRYDSGCGRFLRVLRHHGWERIPAAEAVRSPQELGLESHQRSHRLVRSGMGKQNNMGKPWLLSALAQRSNLIRSLSHPPSRADLPRSQDPRVHLPHRVLRVDRRRTVGRFDHL